LNTILTEGKLWNAALYVRLSRDDGDKEESDSIGNQKALIRSFVKDKKDIRLVDDYEDDGWSGVDFDRPSFKRLLDDIQAGRINCVIVKDLSRLGRNYIETGKLLERFFPFMGVRFIAVNDNYDSQNHNAQTDNLIIPFKNLINDAYCADTSRKIRSQFEVKRQKGEFIGSFAVFGYLKDPDNKNRLIIDENAAPVVRDIFKWKIQGMNQQGIAERLNSLGILSPLEYKKSNGSNFKTKFQLKSKTKWNHVAVLRILQNDVYTGILTQGKSTTPNHKIKQRVKKPREEWVRVEESHEPIISAEDFSLVAALLKKDTRIGSDENAVYPFSGMLVCFDCGQNLVRKNVPGAKGKYVYHICSTNKKGGGCTSHSISESGLYNAIYETITLHIRECVQMSRLLDFINNMPLYQPNTEKLQRQITGKEAEISKLNSRMAELYEDYKDGILSKDEYISFKNIYSGQIVESEKALENLNHELDNIINNQDENCLWIEHFKKYQGIENLTRNIVVELIERITVFEGGKIEVRFRYHNSFENAVQYIKSLPSDSYNERMEA